MRITVGRDRPSPQCLVSTPGRPGVVAPRPSISREAEQAGALGAMLTKETEDSSGLGPADSDRRAHAL